MRFPRSFDLRWALAGSLAVHLLVLAFLRGQTPPPERLLEVDLSELPAKPTPAAVPTPVPVPTTEPQVLATPLPAKPLPTLPRRIVQAPQPTFPPLPKLPPPPEPAPQPTSAPEPTAPPKPVTAPKTQVTIQKTKPKTPAVSTPKTPGRQITRRPTDTGSSPAPQRPKSTFDGQRAPLNNAPDAPRRDNEEAGSARDNNARSPRPLTAMRPPGGERPSPFRTDNNAADNTPNNASSSPAPRGLDASRRAANMPDNAAPTFDPRRFGTTTNAQDKSLGDAQGGSARGRNAELAGSEGAGGLTLPRAVPRRGGDAALARNSTLFASKSDESAPKTSGVDVTPISPGKRLAARDTGAGRDSGGGTGFASSGPNRAAFASRPGSGIGASSGDGIGGAAGKRSGGGGEMAGGGSSGGGLRIGGGNGGNGRSGPRYAANGGTPFGTVGNGNGGNGGNGNGNGAGGKGSGAGNGGGPGGPGRGPRLARRNFGDGDGGAGGPGAGAGGRGGKGFGSGLSQGGGKGGGNGNGGDGGTGGNGTGGRGKGDGAGTGDEAGGGNRGDGEGAGSGRRLALARGRLKTSSEAGREIGRGIWAPGLKGVFYQDADQGVLDPGHAIDWPVLGAPGSKQVRRNTNQTIDFDWGIDAPLKDMRGTYWSVRWTGRIFVPKTDEYRFFLEDVDDGGRLYLDGKKIIDVWLVQRSSPGSGKMRLERGPHEITLEYVQGPATASSVRLMWESASFPRELVGSYIPGS